MMWSPLLFWMTSTVFAVDMIKRVHLIQTCCVAYISVYLFFSVRSISHNCCEVQLNNYKASACTPPAQTSQQFWKPAVSRWHWLQVKPFQRPFWDPHEVFDVKIWRKFLSCEAVERPLPYHAWHLNILLFFLPKLSRLLISWKRKTRSSMAFSFFLPTRITGAVNSMSFCQEIVAFLSRRILETNFKW